MTNEKQFRPKGTSQIRKEKRRGAYRWGYDVWIRQPDGPRKRFRDFSFQTRAEAEQALGVLRMAGWKNRYGIKSPQKPTTLKNAVDSYLAMSKANLLINKTQETTYWRALPGHLRTLQRWLDFVGSDRHVTSITKEDLVYWVANEIERANASDKQLKQSTIKRGLNTIRAALHHAVEATWKFPDLATYRVPKNPLTKKVENQRDRILGDDEIGKICNALGTKPEWNEALFFLQLALLTGARMAELIRMRWDESSLRFGTVKLYSSKTRRWRTIHAPAAATLIANRRLAGLGGDVRVFTRPDHWYRKALRQASESVGISYGQQISGGWTVHDLRHTCLTNLAIAGVPIHAIKEYAGHAIVDTQRYLSVTLDSIQTTARVIDRLAALCALS